MRILDPQRISFSWRVTIIRVPKSFGNFYPKSHFFFIGLLNMFRCFFDIFFSLEGPDWPFSNGVLCDKCEQDSKKRVLEWSIERSNFSVSTLTSFDFYGQIEQHCGSCHLSLWARSYVLCQILNSHLSPEAEGLGFRYAVCSTCSMGMGVQNLTGRNVLHLVFLYTPSIISTNLNWTSTMVCISVSAVVQYLFILWLLERNIPIYILKSCFTSCPPKTCATHLCSRNAV